MKLPPFDVTKPMTPTQDAALARDVLQRFADGAGPLTPGDARRVIQAIEALYAMRVAPAADRTAADQPEIDRCPHCGKWGQEERYDLRGWFVACHPCGAAGPVAQSPAEAVRAWNDRHDPQRYAIGLIVEEAGETLQLLGKALRFGLDAKRRDGESARSLLPIETGDLMAALAIGDLAGLWDTEDHHARQQTKLRRLLDPASRDDEGRRLAPDFGRRAAELWAMMKPPTPGGDA